MCSGCLRTAVGVLGFVLKKYVWCFILFWRKCQLQLEMILPEIFSLPVFCSENIFTGRAELFIFRNIKFLINWTLPLTSLLTLCILECVYARLRVSLTDWLTDCHSTTWLETKYQGSLEPPHWSKLQYFLLKLNDLKPRGEVRPGQARPGYHSITSGGPCWGEELCWPTRPDRRGSQLQLHQEGGRGQGERGREREEGDDDTSNCWHWTLNSPLRIAWQCNVLM